ncbi:MAG: class I fructose-bisphosphate aldolase [Gemmatimonadota bacterium]
MAATTSEAAAGVGRPTIDDLGLGTGKRARLYDMLYNHGARNGTLQILPIDHGMEHGPIDFFPNPASADPDFQFELAVRGDYSGIACQIGFAEKYYPRYAGRVPLILKVNGKTNIPPDDDAHSPLNATVEDAVRLGAHAVGYTLYVGSPEQSRHHEELNLVRAECERYGLPLIVWSYPRGSAIEAKGGRDCIYAVDYAARLAMEMGADVVKLNVPKKSDKDALMPEKYRQLEWDYAEGARRVVKSAGRTMVLFSGGSKLGDDDLIEKARLAMEAGATGLIFGRNMWQRPMEEALAITARVRELFVAYGA